MSKRVIRVNFRWNVEQVGPAVVEVQVPVGPGAPLINPEAVKQLHLTDAEVDMAETAALRKIVVLD